VVVVTNDFYVDLCKKCFLKGIQGKPFMGGKWFSQWLWNKSSTTLRVLYLCWSSSPDNCCRAESL